MFTTYNILRSFHNSWPRLVRGPTRRSNPGNAYQLNAFDVDDAEQLALDPGNLESDFTTVHQTHRHHEKEMQQQREQIRRWMVKNKYFRDQKLPNMLTYAEKEQIRLLHTRDPEEWTPERLAESFPATTEVVHKVLQSQWRPYSSKRIRLHDEAVLRNWEQLRSGGSDAMQLPIELREHLLKFAHREIKDLQTSALDWPNRLALPKPKGKEFLSIITSCSKYRDENPVKQLAPKTSIQNINQSGSAGSEAETYLLNKIKDKRNMRLQELKQFKLTASEVSTTNQTESKTLEHRALEAFGSSSGTGVLPESYTEKFHSNEIVISAEDQQRFEMTSVKDRIHIPRKVWRKGATFRVEDCYYDDDGEFLYRVPGMTGKN